MHGNGRFALTLRGRTGGSQLARAPVLHTVRAAHLVVTVFTPAHAQLTLLTLQLQLLFALLVFNAVEARRAVCNGAPAHPALLPRSRGAELAAAARVHHAERTARNRQRGARARLTGPAGARGARDRSGGEHGED